MIARWLLIARSRLESDVMPMTHEFLSSMLGVRRTGVTEIATKLRRSGLIRYHHGEITILDREALEATTSPSAGSISRISTDLTSSSVSPTGKDAGSVADLSLPACFSWNQSNLNIDDGHNRPSREAQLRVASGIPTRIADRMVARDKSGA